MTDVPATKPFRFLAAGIPGLLLAALWWWMAGRMISGHADLVQANLRVVIVQIASVLVVFGLWAGLCAQAMFLPSRWWRWGMAVLTGLTVLVLFPWSVWTAMSAVVVAGSIGIMLEQAAADVRLTKKVRPWVIIERAATPLLWGMMVALSLLYYRQVAASSKSPEALADQLIGQSVSIAERFLPSIYPAYKPTETVDDFLGAQIPSADSLVSKLNFGTGTLSADQVRQQINTQLGTTNIDLSGLNLPTQVSADQLRAQLTTQLKSVRESAVADTRAELAKRFAITLTGTETMHDAVTAIIGRQFDQTVRQYVRFVPALLAVSLFLVLRLFTFLFVWAAAGGGWLMTSVFRAAGILRQRDETVVTKVLEW